MADMKDFKRIADAIMSDVTATEGLKRKVIAKCRKKRGLQTVYLMRAACLAVIFGLTIMFSVSPRGRDPEISASPGSILMATQEGEQPYAASSPGIFEEARKAFGDSFLEPAYIPDGFTLAGTEEQPSQSGEINRIVMNYVAGDRSFIIVEEKGQAQGDYSGYETIDINGSTGYLESNNNAEGDDINTELHWSFDGTQYAVQGYIRYDDAVKTARSMK